MAIITNTEVANYMRVKTSDTTSMAYITDYIGKANSMLIKYLGQAIEEVSAEVKTFSGTGTHEYVIYNHPISTVSKLETRSNLSASWTTVDSGDYEIRTKDTGITEIIYYKGFSYGSYNYRITFDYGYASADIPEDVKLGMIKLTVSLLRETNLDVLGKDRLGTSNISTQDVSNMTNENTTFYNVWNSVRISLRSYKIVI